MSELIECVDNLTVEDIIRRIAKTANGLPFYLQTQGLCRLSMMKSGRGKFAVGIESWNALGGNTVVNDGGALRITYVDHASGATNFLTSADDMRADLADDTVYRFRFKAKVNAGAVTIRLYKKTGAIEQIVGIVDTSYQWYEMTHDILSGATTPRIQFAGMGAGEIIWIDEWIVEEWRC